MRELLVLVISSRARDLAFSATLRKSLPKRGGLVTRQRLGMLRRAQHERKNPKQPTSNPTPCHELKIPATLLNQLPANLVNEESSNCVLKVGPMQRNEAAILRQFDRPVLSLPKLPFSGLSSRWGEQVANDN